MTKMIYPNSVLKKYSYYLLIIFVTISSLIIYFSSYNFFGLRFFSVQTGSMIPEINIGDLILVKRFEEYKLGDVITVDKEIIGLVEEHGSKYLTHRVVEVNKSLKTLNQYRIKGDKNEFPDQIIIAQDAVVGKVINKYHYLGSIIDYLKTDEGMAIFIFTPAAYIIFTELKNIKKILRQDYLRKKFEL